MQSLNKLIFNNSIRFQKKIGKSAYVYQRNNLKIHQLNNGKPLQNMSFFLKKDKFVDPENGEIRISEVSKYAAISMVGASLIFIAYYCYTIEEKSYIKAQKYLKAKKERGEDINDISSTQLMSEEYRTEYIEKTKRKYQKMLKDRQEQEYQQKIAQAQENIQKRENIE